MYDNETKDKFVELRAAGKSFGDIAQELSVVKSTLHRWEDERADDIARLRRIEWEEQEHRWGRNIEELMAELVCDMSDYEMRLRQFTDNLNNLSFRDAVMLLRESRREYFRLRAMLMGTAPRARSQRKTAPESQLPASGDVSAPVASSRLCVEPPSETKSNETERLQQNGTTQHRNTNDLQQPEPQSFDFQGASDATTKRQPGAVQDQSQIQNPQSQIVLEGGAPRRAVTDDSPLPEATARNSESKINDPSQLANDDSSLNDFGGESIPISPFESTREWLERQGIQVSKVPKGARIITSP